MDNNDRPSCTHRRKKTAKGSQLLGPKPRVQFVCQSCGTIPFAAEPAHVHSDRASGTPIVGRPRPAGIEAAVRARRRKRPANGGGPGRALSAKIEEARASPPLWARSTGSPAAGLWQGSAVPGRRIPASASRRLVMRPRAALAASAGRSDTNVSGEGSGWLQVRLRSATAGSAIRACLSPPKPMSEGHPRDAGRRQAARFRDHLIRSRTSWSDPSPGSAPRHRAPRVRTGGSHANGALRQASGAVNGAFGNVT